MRNLLVKMSYDGSNYHGFQIQKNAITIEQVLKNAIHALTGEDANIIGCGRTDAGVHAINYYFNFATVSTIPEDRFPLAFNSKLPYDISVSFCQAVSMDFHSRFSAVKKTYLYKIYNSKIRNPFLHPYSYFYPIKLDIEKMNLAALKIIGEKDFCAFMAQGSPVSSTVRTVYDISIKKNGDIVEIEVTGNGFLYNMVRIIVGTLIMAGTGKISDVDIDGIIASKKRENAGMTVPACGLYLKEVYYG